MISLPTARRHAEEFAAAVDGGDAPVGPELERLVGVATELRAGLEAVAPREEFAAKLRALLLAEAATVLTPENAALSLPPRRRSSRERRLVAAAAAFVVVGGTAGMATAAESALPGQALYPVKRGIERAQAGLSVSTAGRGRDLLGQADDRLAEVRGLLASDPVGAAQVPATIEDFTTQAAAGADLLMASYRDTRDPAAILAVRTFTAQALTSLEALEPQAPPAAQDELARAALMLQGIDARAGRLCDTCAQSLPPLKLPRMFLTAAEVERALARADGKQLDNSHPVAVDTSTLRRAVEPKAAPTSQPSAPRPGSGSSPAAPGAESSSTGAPSTVPSVPSSGQTDPVKTVKKTVKQAVGNTLGDLGGTRTLLPDPTQLP